MDSNDRVSRRSFLNGLATVTGSVVAVGVPAPCPVIAGGAMPLRIGFFETVHRPSLTRRLSDAVTINYRASDFGA